MKLERTILNHRPSRTGSAFLLAIYAGLALILSACAPLAARAPEPTPEWIQVYAGPVWQPLQPVLAECIPSGAAIAYTKSPAQADVVLAWGGSPPPDWTAFELGDEILSVIVHPSSPANSISSEGLRLVYTAEIRDWDFLGQDPAPIAAWGYPLADEVSAVARFAGLDVDAVKLVAPAPAEMRAAVAADPAAIGLLPRRWLDSSVRELPVDGLEPGVLRASLLAFTSGEPQGMLRSWLFCLQERIPE